MQFHQFQRTAADIAQNPIRTGKAEQHAIGGKPRFLVTR